MSLVIVSVPQAHPRTAQKLLHECYFFIIISRSFGERLQILLVGDFLKDLQHDVVRHWVFSLSRLQEFLVKADGAAFALDVLIQKA